MTDLNYESLGRPPRAGDTILYTEERIIPLGTWGVELAPLLTAYGVAMRDRLAEDGYQVELDEDLSSIEATGLFELTYTIALEVLEAPPEPPGVPPEELEAAWWGYFGTLAVVALAFAVGWIADSFARIAEAERDTDPEPLIEREATRQTFAVALVLALAFLLLWKAL